MTKWCLTSSDKEAYRMKQQEMACCTRIFWKRCCKMLQIFSACTLWTVCMMRRVACKADLELHWAFSSCWHEEAQESWQISLLRSLRHHCLLHFSTSNSSLRSPRSVDSCARDTVWPTCPTCSSFEFNHKIQAIWRQRCSIRHKEERSWTKHDITNVESASSATTDFGRLGPSTLNW